MLAQSLLGLTFLFAQPAGGAGDDPKTKAEIDRLQGAWSVVALEIDGAKLDANGFKGAKIILSGNSFTTMGMGGDYKGTIKVDVSKSPKTLDLTFTDGPEKGNTSLAIYDLDGDNLKLCLTLTAKDRPKEFATKAGGGCALETLKREQTDKDKAALKEEMARLGGEWTMVSGEISGQPMAEAMAKTGKRVAKDTETTITIGGQLFLKATFTIDIAKKPKTIDYVMTDGLSKGKTQLGIYEFDGDTLRFCFASPGMDRPTTFTTQAGDGRTLSVWRKEKKTSR